VPIIYRIHPAIGIARVGDSPDEYFVGPEAPGVPPSLNRPDFPHDPNAGYKDDQGRIKRQGARFRIYEHTFDDAGALIQAREITAADAQIEWEVHLANRKAAAPNFQALGRRNKGEDESRLIIDAGPQKISGAGQDMKRLQGRFMDVDVPLGDLFTDGA
jgi:L-Lysine epsilon oxidase N-terminal